MPTSIYLSSENVTAVNGKQTGRGVKITSYGSAPLEEGVMINGVITEEAAIQNVLSALRRKGVINPKDARLVIDSSSVFTKLETVPRLSARQLEDYTRNIFMDAAQSREELLYDYACLPGGTGGKQQILCSAVESSLIQSYVQLFSKSRIELASISVSLSSIIHLMNKLDYLQKKSFILCILDGNIMITSLFLAGGYRFSNRQRLLNPRGTPQSTAELMQCVSSMLQFNTSEKTGYTIDSVYFCGLREEESGVYQDISSEMRLTAQKLHLTDAFLLDLPDTAAPFSLSDYLYAAGNLI